VSGRNTVIECKIVLCVVSSHPLEVPAASPFLKNKRPDRETIRQTADIAAKPAKPLDDADLNYYWRKQMVRVVIEQALELGNDQPGRLDG
jgi:CO/xanthine dehydrogenase FAD-binding subunit